MITLKTRIECAAVVAAVAALTVLATDSKAYNLSGPKWNTLHVPYYVNPVNLDLPNAPAQSSVQFGADTWHQQAGVDFSFDYAGESSAATNTFDGVNLVFFRNASSGNAIATTYWWSNGANILDADIVFWDGAFKFFSGSTGCSGGFYIEDIAAHEFGHALGLGHSDSTNATMYPSVSSCDTRNRTLDTDDIAGVRALYPQLPVPNPPTGVRIIS